MNRTMYVVVGLVLVGALLVGAPVVTADEPDDPEEDCINVYVDPPGAAIDPACYIPPPEPDP